VLRHDLRSTGRAPWGPAPLRGLAEGGCAPPLNRWSARHPAARGLRTPNACRVSTRHAARRSTPGGRPRGARPSRPWAGGRSPSP
jgi:hypothetical protein